MMISAITSVSPARSYARVNFNGRKNSRNENYSGSNSGYLNSVKNLAVPLAATILAISPMSSSATGKNMNIDHNAVNTELAIKGDEPKEILVGSVNVPENISTFGGGVIRLYSTDDDLEYAEKAVLYKYREGMGMVTVDMSDGLQVENYIKTNGVVLTKYYIKNGQRFTKTDDNGQKKIVVYGTRTKIGKDFYDFIIKSFGDGMPVETKTEKEEKKENRSSGDYISPLDLILINGGI